MCNLYFSRTRCGECPVRTKAVNARRELKQVYVLKGHYIIIPRIQNDM